MRRATRTPWIGLGAVLLLVAGIGWWLHEAADSTAIATRESKSSAARESSAPAVLADVPNRVSTTRHVAPELALPAGHAWLRVVVRTRAGDAPVPESKWRVGDVTVVTDAHGEFELAVAADEQLELLCLAPEVFEQRVPALAEREIRELTVRVGPTAADFLRIRVVDESTRAPLANVSFLALSRFVARVDKLDVGARTDDHGEATIDVRRWKPFDALVAAPEYALRAIPVELDPPRPELELALSRSAPLTVEVAGSKEHRDEIRVELEFERRALFAGRVHGDPAQHMVYETTLDPDGRVRFDSLPTGVPLGVSARVRRRARVQRTVTLTPLQATVVSIDFTTPSTVRGVLRAEERLLGGVELVLERVRPDDATRERDEWWSAALDDARGEAFATAPAEPRRASTGPDGAFRFDAVPPGAWHVGNEGSGPAGFAAAAGNELVRVHTRTVDVFGDGQDVEVDLTADVGWSARGRVIDSAGSPIARALVWQVVRGDDGMVIARADERGEFVTGLIEQPQVVLFATADPIPTNALLTLGYGEEDAPWGAGHASAAQGSTPIAVESTSTDLVLRVPRGARVCGSTSGVHDPESGLTSFRLVSASGLHDSLFTDDDPPRFCFEGLAPGNYRVLVRADRDGTPMLGLSAEFELAAGTSLDGVVVPLAPAGYLRDAVNDDPRARRATRPTCVVEVDGVRLTPFRSEYFDDGVLPTPAGHVRILADERASAQSPTAPGVWCEFDLAPGETRTVVLPEAK